MRRPSLPLFFALGLILLSVLWAVDAGADKFFAAGPFHIGDTEWEPCPPSTPQSESLHLTFEIGGFVTSAGLSLSAGHVNVAARVDFNGTTVGYLPATGDGPCEPLSHFASDVGSLAHAGVNSIDVYCGAGSPALDDIWVHDVRVAYTTEALEPVYSLEGPIHLGDGTVPSCNPSAPSGTSLIGAFVSPYLPGDARLRFEAAEVRGGEYVSVVLVNGNQVGIVPASPSEDCNIYNALFSESITGYVQPGENSFEIRCGLVGANYEDMWIRDIVVDLHPPLSSPYEILSASFEQDHYQNGHATDPLVVVTRSNWGSGTLTLEASLVTTGEVRFSLGTDAFSLSPGMEHQSSFPFTVPANTAPWDFYVEVSLKQDGVPVASFAELGFTGTPLSQAEIDNQVAYLDECHILPDGTGLPWALARAAALGTIAGPGFGMAAGVIGILEASCLEEHYKAIGDTCRADAAGTLALSSIGSLGTSVFICALVAAGAVQPEVVAIPALFLSAFGIAVSYVGTENIIDWWCEEVNPRGGFGGVGDGARVRSLLGNISDVCDSVGVDFSMHFAAEGPVLGRVQLPIGWIDTDSTSVDDVAAFMFAPDTLQWVSIGSTTSRLLAGIDSTAAPTDSLWPKTISMKATRAGDVFLGVAYRAVGSDATISLFYPTVTVLDSTRMSVTIEDHIGAFPLEIDWTGDGQVDSLLFPEGTSGVESEPVRGSSGRALSLASMPNPTAGSTALLLQSPGNLKSVTVSVYDVAGREVRKLSVGDLSLGAHQVLWDGRGDDGRQVASGIYYCTASYAGGASTTKRLVVLR